MSLRTAAAVVATAAAERHSSRTVDILWIQLCMVLNMQCKKPHYKHTFAVVCLSIILGLSGTFDRCGKSWHIMSSIVECHLF